MTLEDLRDEIESLCGSCEDPSKIKVRLALQPNYPMKGSIRNLCMEHGEDGEPKTLWIACSDNEAYGCPREAWEDNEIFWEEEE